MRFARFPKLLAALLITIGCRDAVGPEPPSFDEPVSSHSGTGPGIHGVGSIGSGEAAPGAIRQDFEFDVAWDLTGSLFYRDWNVVRGDGTAATVTVSADDAGTRISTFRDGSTACADATRGAEFDGTGRLDTGDLVSFTVVACDNGPAGSGADGFRMSVPSAGGYQREGLLSSGDVVKASGTVPPTTSTEVSGLGAIGTGTATPGSDWQTFDFAASATPGGRMVFTDYAVVRADGSTGRMTVDSETDPATGVTSYQQISSTCVRFGGTGRIDTGELWTFFIDACDNASPGAGFDSFAITLPDRAGPGVPYTRSGTLASGDIVLGSAAPTTGDLSVTTTSAGSSLDPDGYTVTVDGTTSQSIANSGSVTFTGLPAGSHSVALSGVAANCTVSGGNSRTVDVPAGGTASTTFSVSCTTPGGNLDVTTTTTGSNLDADGYTVTVDGATTRAIPINGSVRYTDLSAGSHTVALSGVAANCTVSGGSSRTVTVPSGGTASVAFTVSCVAAPATRLVFTVQPSNTATNSTIRPAVEVTALDAEDNRATSYSGLVTIAIGRNGGGWLTPGTLSGTKTVRAVNGVATFSDLSINRSGDYTLRVTASGLTGAESRTFTIGSSSSICLLGICLL